MLQLSILTCGVFFELSCSLKFESCLLTLVIKLKHEFTVVMMLNREEMIKMDSALQATSLLVYFMSPSVRAFQIFSRPTLADE